MKKIKTFIPIYLLGILICGTLAVVSFFVGVKPLIKLNNVIKNGTETNAIVVNIKESNAKVNDEATYYLVVEYLDSEGNTATGQTLDFFLYEDTYALGTQITIKYIGSDIVHGDSLFETAGIFTIVFSIASLITGILTLFLLAMMGKGLVAASNTNGLLKSGTPAYAHFVERGKSMTMGKTKYFSVIYEYKDANGDYVRVKSPKNYTDNEVSALSNANSFEVRTKGKRSIIAYDFNNPKY